MNTLELSQEQIDLKRRLDEAAEKEEIKSFDEQIESLDKLSFSEAKRLYEIANNSDFDSIREAYIKWIVSGTLYVVDDFIKKNQLELLENSKYDIDDIRSALIETWIEIIEEGKLLKAYSLPSMLNEKETYNKLYEKLGEKYWSIKKHLGISLNELSNSLLIYLNKKNNQEEVSEEDILENIYTEDISSKEIEQIMRLFDSIYNTLNDNESEELKISPSKAKKLIKLLVNREIQEELSENVYEDDPYEPILQDIHLEHLVEDVDKLVNSREKISIHERLGLDGEEVQKNIDIGKKINVSSSRVRDIRKKAYRKIRENKNFIVKYGEEPDIQKLYYYQMKRRKADNNPSKKILFGISPTNIDVLLHIYDRVFEIDQNNENKENTKREK